MIGLGSFHLDATPTYGTSVSSPRASCTAPRHGAGYIQPAIDREPEATTIKQDLLLRDVFIREVCLHPPLRVCPSANLERCTQCGITTPILRRWLAHKRHKAQALRRVGSHYGPMTGLMTCRWLDPKVHFTSSLRPILRLPLTTP